jgi:hypothetical protein
VNWKRLSSEGLKCCATRRDQTAAEVRVALGQGGRQCTLVVSVGPWEPILRARLASSFWGMVRVVDAAFCPNSL